MRGPLKASWRSYLHEYFTQIGHSYLYFIPNSCHMGLFSLNMGLFTLEFTYLGTILCKFIDPSAEERG